MSPDTEHLYSLEEYYAVEEIAEARYEYWDGEIVCMSGGTPEHAIITGNLHFRIRLNLVGTKCSAFTGDQAVKSPLALPPYVYPDVTVTCGRPEFQRMRGIGLLLNPTAIIEVLSPSSEVRDRAAKRELCMRIASLQEYILVAQDKPEVVQHYRRGDGDWTSSVVSGFEADLALLSVDCSIPLREVYENVEWSACDSFSRTKS